MTSNNYNHVSFQNPGLIDINAIKTMGVNVKENDSPIGYFGTGLKYAIAVLIRTGHEITIYRGLTPYHLSFRPTLIRNKSFNIITINDEPMGITTELGKNWKLWMALRELECNVLDENGASDNTYIGPKENFTTVIVKGSEFYDTYAQLPEIILQSKPLFTEAHVDVHEGRSKYVYYRGVRVHELENGMETKYTYNVKRKCDLTEDRTFSNFSYVAMFYITYAFFKTKDKKFIKDVLTVTENYLEHHETHTFLWHHAEVMSRSNEFDEVVDELYRSFNKDLNELILKWWLKKSGKEFEFEPYRLTPGDNELFNEACALCSQIGFEVPRDKIEFVKTLNDKAKIAIVVPDLDKIYISYIAFTRGCNYLASTLLEETIHYQLDYNDESRQMQDFLFDLIIKLAIELKSKNNY